jgi:hypothetical protein
LRKQYLKEIRKEEKKKMDDSSVSAAAAGGTSKDKEKDRAGAGDSLGIEVRS